MKKIGQILAEMEPETRKNVEMLINRCLKSVDCNVDWEEFRVYKNSEKIAKKMLLNAEAQYFLAIAQAAEEADVEQVKVSFVKGFELDCLKVINQRNSMLAIVLLGTESMK